MLEHGQEDLSEWSERKRGVLYQLGNYYKKRVLKMKCLLKECSSHTDCRTYFDRTPLFMLK